jgi:hypothetical protein
MSRFIPNSTMIPNAFFDEVMHQLSEKALRTYLIIARKTTGWGKEWDSISISQFRQLTGIKDERTIRSGLNELIYFGLVKPLQKPGHPTKYALSLDADLSNLNVVPPASNVPTTPDAPPASDVSNPLHEMHGDPLHEMHPTKTINKTTITKTKKDISEAKSEDKTEKEKTEKEILADYGITGQIAKDFLKIRKAKRSPLTITAMEGISSEASKAGISVLDAVTICAQKGWQGFNAGWNWQEQKILAPSENRQPGSISKQPSKRTLPHDKFKEQDYGESIINLPGFPGVN